MIWAGPDHKPMIIFLIMRDLEETFVLSTKHHHVLDSQYRNIKYALVL
jgi:hypothetical protein